MGLFENKRLRELEKENEELLFRINSISEKEDNVRHLNDVLKKMRLEVSDLNERKISLATDIENLKEQKRLVNIDIENYNKDILNLKNLKLEEQNTLLMYSSQIDKIKNKISNDENFNDLEIDFDHDSINKRNREIEELNREFENLRDRIFTAEEKIEELNN